MRVLYRNVLCKCCNNKEYCIKEAIRTKTTDGITVTKCSNYVRRRKRKGAKDGKLRQVYKEAAICT